MLESSATGHFRSPSVVLVDAEYTVDILVVRRFHSCDDVPVCQCVFETVE